MSRIPLVPLDLDEPKDVVDAIRARRGGVLTDLDRLLLNSPPLAAGWNVFLGTVRQKLSLDPKIREIVMCRVAVVNRAEYEFFHHASEYLKAGGTPEEVEAMKDPGVASRPDGPFDERACLVIELTDTMTRAVDVPQALFDRAAALFPRTELMDLVAMIATYNMVSRVVVACRLMPEH